MDVIIVVLFGLGLIAGIVAGIFGLGGGILFTPILFIIFNDANVDNPVVLAIGSSLFCTFVAAVGSSVRQLLQQNFYWWEGSKVGLLGAAGVTLGKYVITSRYYNEQIFVIFFSLLLLYVAYMFYQRGSTQKQSKRIVLPVTFKEAGIAGGLGGFVAALAGIGGGGVMVPILNLLYQRPFQKAVSISSLAIVFISLSGWLQLALTNHNMTALTSYYLGYVDFGAALPLAVSGLIGGFLGAWLHMKINRRYLQLSFAVLAIGMAFKLLWEVF